MTLLGYVDSLAELSYYGRSEDPEGVIEYVERWESRQPKRPACVEQAQNEVKSADDLRRATLEEAQESLAKELPELFEDAEVRMREDALMHRTLAALAKRHQWPYSQKGSEQLRCYKLWQGCFIQNGQLPNRDTLSTTTAKRLFSAFPQASDYSDLAIIFGFGDQLPADQQDPELIECLQYQGFKYTHERSIVRDNRDMALHAVIEQRATKCAAVAATTVQSNIDDIVFRTKHAMHDEKLKADWEHQHEAKRTRQSTQPPKYKYNYAKRSNGGPEQARSSTRTTYHSAHMSYTSAQTSGLFASLGAAIRTLVNEVVNLTDELFDGEYPGGEPK